MKLRSSLLAAVALLGTAFTATADTWTIDPVHSSVDFTVRHFFNKVSGTFAKFSGTIEFDAAKPEAAVVDATIEIASVDTRSERRDGHLQRDDFFDAAKFPAITFKSTKWTKTGDNTFDVAGNLTIKDVTKPVTLKTKLLGVGPGRPGKTISGWEATTTLNRKDFGVAGGPPGTVGDEVEIALNIQAGK